MIWRIIKLDGENLSEMILGALFYIIPFGLIISLVINPTGVSDFVTKVPPIKSIMCSSLKSEIVANDEIGRELWNSYQTEISSLADRGNSETSYFEYQDKIKNVARRGLQLLTNDKASLSRMNGKKYCLSGSIELDKVLDALDQALVNAQAVLDGKTSNWNNNFYSTYQPLSVFLK